MLRMVSYSHRLKSGQITFYLDRTNHVPTTLNFQVVDLSDFGSLRCTAIEDVLRNSMFSFRSGKAWL